VISYRRMLAATIGILGLSACQESGNQAYWNMEPPIGQPASVAPHKDSPTTVATTNAGDRAYVVEGAGPMVGKGHSRQSASPGEGGVTLNLANLPIAEAAKTVLADMAGVNYVIDPRLDGKVTVHTSHPVSKQEALDLFQSALRVSGAALVKAGGIYKIVPAEGSATVGADISTGTSGIDKGDSALGASAVVVPLRYVSASEMKRVLEPITAKGGIVRADDARHAITINGSPQDIANIREAIDLFDIDTMRGMSFALMPVKSSDPNALADDLRAVFASEKEGPMNGMIQFIGNRRLSSVLVISAQREYLDRARVWITRLDARAQGSEKQFFTYRVQNRPAKELLQVLLSMFGSEGSGHSTSSVSPRQGQASLATNTSLSGQNGTPSANPIGGISSTGTAGGAPAGSGTQTGVGDVASILAGGKPTGADSTAAAEPETTALGEDSRFRLAADEAKNALVIMATPDDYKRIMRVIETLDVMPNQVFIEAMIAEVTLNDQLQFGVESFLQKGKSAAALSNSSITPAPADALGNNPMGAAVAAAFPGFSYALRTASAQVTLNALNQVTSLNIISTPSLTVVDNHQAILQVGDQVPVTSLQSATALGNTFTSVSYRDTGVILSITPHISESGHVTLNLVQEVSNVSPDAAAGSTNPTIQQRKVNTQVVVNDGDSLMLGGLMQNSRIKTGNQVPILGDIPFLGSAFTNKSDAVGKTELLIMITPHVVRSVAEAREITEDYKKQILSISRDAIKRPHNLRQSVDRVLLDH